MSFQSDIIPISSSSRIVEYAPPKSEGGGKKYSFQWLNTLADEMVDFFLNPKDKENPPIFLKEFCLALKLPASYISQFARENAKFARALELVKDYQEVALAHKGFKSQSATMAIFALKNVARWRDRQEEEQKKETRIRLELHLPSKTPLALPVEYVGKKRGRPKKIEPARVEIVETREENEKQE